jgi:hypothetical protein
MLRLVSEKFAHFSDRRGLLPEKVPGCAIICGRKPSEVSGDINAALESWAVKFSVIF